jgi:hypothetical protein
MRVTESQLRRIIREEAARVVREGYDDPGAAALDAFVSVIETYAQDLLAGDNESSAKQYDAIAPALDHLREVDPGLTSADAYEMVSSVMGRVFEEGGHDSDDALDHVLNIDKNIIEPAFMSPAVESTPAPRTPPAALGKVLRRAGKAARDLKVGKGPKNFDMNETLRRRLGR